LLYYLFLTFTHNPSLSLPTVAIQLMPSVINAPPIIDSSAYSVKTQERMHNAKTRLSLTLVLHSGILKAYLGALILTMDLMMLLKSAYQSKLVLLFQTVSNTMYLLMEQLPVANAVVLILNLVLILKHALMIRLQQVLL
jgi:hypothetical protein